MPMSTVTTADWEAWSCRVRLAVTEPAALAGACAVLSRHLTDVERACSRFHADSELAGLDATAGRWTDVSPLLADLLATALRAARLTDGDVDPTVGGSLGGLGYDRDIRLRRAADGVVVALPAPGWACVELDREAGRVRVPAGVRLDLGATAKAWTADTAAADIARRTGAGCLVSLGGDVAVAGPPPDGGWRIRVEDVAGDPDAAPSGPCAEVTIGDGGLATSSTLARRWQRGGMELHHLLDPRTGLPAVPAWRTVSVAAGSCVDANTVSTAAIVRGHGVWPWLRAVGVPIRLVTVDGQVLTTGGWPADAAAWYLIGEPLVAEAELPPALLRSTRSVAALAPTRGAPAAELLTQTAARSAATEA
jgi:thiamine biosynthesis lipoprotein